MELLEIGKRAKAAEPFLRTMGVEQKNNVLKTAADLLFQWEDKILQANEEDIRKGIENNMNQGLLDRLRLNHERIAGMAEGLTQLVALDDPVGEVISMKQRPNGLQVGQKRVPLGVIGIIYEARPNVTVDAFGLCFKTGNVVVLKGGSDALSSNKVIVECLKSALDQEGVPRDAILLIEDTNRETTKKFMKMNDYIDVLIPRGGAGLIRTVVENSTIPVIETGTGNCHIYVDKGADLDMAAAITVNAKTQRIGVCNSCESLVVHSEVAEQFLPLVKPGLDEFQVEIRGDERCGAILEGITPAVEADWGTEYLDYIISVKIVDSIEEAIAHINKYSTKHSEAIITNDYNNSQKFLNEVDAAAVYVNASTRFTDGFEFGFGAEIGISTQKLHARGPMGLEALTTTKYIIYGSGQVRK